jgi:hypothetical protein
MTTSGLPELVSDAAEDLVHLIRVGDIGGEGVRSGGFVRQLHQTLFGACEIQPADVKGPFNKTIPQSLENKRS